MYIKKFSEEENIVQYIEVNPENYFEIYDNTVYYNEQNVVNTKLTASTLFDQGDVRVSDLNIDRPNDSLVVPFVYKDSNRAGITVGETDDYDSAQYGQKLKGTYPLTASISRSFYDSNSQRREINSLKNGLNYYSTRSPHYQYSSSLGDKSTQKLNAINVPKLFYGERIEKGTVNLNFYISGSLIGRLEDTRGNGELVQTAPSGSQEVGQVAGVCMYQEGFIILTGSWALDSQQRDYQGGGSSEEPSWLYFGAGMNDDAISLPSSSYDMTFNGKQTMPVVTLLAKSNNKEHNYTSNMTYVKKGQETASQVTENRYKQKDDINLVNPNPTEYEEDVPYQREIYISRINVYDDDKDLVGIATLSKPVRKNKHRSFKFKLKKDM